MAIISFPGQGPIGVPDNAVEKCVKNRMIERGDLDGADWKGEAHLIEVSQVQKNPSGDDLDKVLKNKTITWNLNVNPFLASTPDSGKLKGIEKLTIITHATVCRNQAENWDRGGLFSGFQPTRTIVYAEEVAGFLQCLGFDGRSIDVIGCLSALFAKSLSNMFPGTKVKGYATPVSIDTTGTIKENRLPTAGKASVQTYKGMNFPESSLYSGADKFTDMTQSKMRFIQGSAVQKGNHAQAFAGNSAAAVAKHLHKVNFIGELQLPVGNYTIPNAILLTGQGSLPSQAPLAAIVPSILNYSRLRRDYASAVQKMQGIATQSGLRVIVAGPKYNDLFKYILEEVGYQTEDLSKQGYRLKMASISDCQGMSCNEIRLYAY